jgi:zinc/manganese transport system substrate-binding protein
VRTAAACVAISLSAITVSLGSGIVLNGCGSGVSPHPRAATVVASTDVWGSVARTVAGGHVSVKSILNSADVDPHTYEVTADEAAAIADAALVVYNGGGYDPWVGEVLAGHPEIASVDAYSLIKSADDKRTADEHVFYDVDVAKAVAAQIADRLAIIDPGHADEYRSNSSKFGRGTDAIAQSEHAIAAAHPRASVIAIESVAYYLLVASGLVNRTPATFTAATENDDDPSPADMAWVLDMINGRQVVAVLINPQTATAATNDPQAAARHAGVPVTDVTETLPAGADYLTWQRTTVDHLAAALQTAAR